MSLDLAAVGYNTQPYEFKYDWKTTVLYALGIGARRDDLDYLYEGCGPQVYPSFAVIPAFSVLHELMKRCGATLESVVHGGQSIRLHGPIPSAGQLLTIGTVRGIYDLKRLSQIVFSTHTELEGQLLFETEWMIVVRGVGGFGGPRPPKTLAPTVAREQPSDWEHIDQTLPEQALLYRLSGDHNPLHADPEVARRAGFEQGPILHGLCTFGFLARAVVAKACAGQPERLKSLHAQFRKPVFPGDTLKTQGFVLPDGRVAVQTFAADRPDPVISQAFAEISPP